MASFLKTLKKNKTVKLFNNLCGPAQVYLALSILSVLAIFTQNYSNPHHYCVGFFKANSSCNNKVYFLFKFIYITFWTFIIHKLCKSGFTTISWLIVLFPFILMFLIIMMLILHLVQVEYKMKNNQ